MAKACLCTQDGRLLGKCNVDNDTGAIVWGGNWFLRTKGKGQDCDHEFTVFLQTWDKGSNQNTSFYIPRSLDPMKQIKFLEM